VSECSEIVNVLRREGYSADQITGPHLKGQLVDLIKMRTRKSRVRESQDNVAVALAGIAHLAEPVDELRVEPNPNQAVGTRARRHVGRPQE
jgi:hypothetical protein